MSELESTGLERLVCNWREHLCQTDAIGADALDELEQHVRDAFSELLSKGLRDEEAFLIATRRLGKPSELAEEYQKVSGSPAWTRRVCWMLAGCLLFVLLSQAIETVSWVGQCLAMICTEYRYLAASVSIAITAVCWAAVVFLLCRHERVQRVGHGGDPIQRFRGSTMALLCLTPLLVVLAIRLFATVTAARLVPAETFGESALVLAYSNELSALVIPTALLALLLILRKRLPKPIPSAA